MTRAAVKSAAKELGYTPNPEVKRLMGLLRRGRLVGFRAVLYVFRDAELLRRSPSINATFAIFRERAVALGYSVEVVDYPETKTGVDRISREMKSRGAEGILLLPKLEPFVLHPHFRWADYSVLSLYFDVIPGCDVVRFNWYQALQLAIRELLTRSLSRIGVLVARRIDRYTRDVLTSSILACRARLPDSVSIELVYIEDLGRPGYGSPCPELMESRGKEILLQQWNENYRPEALIITSDDVAEPVLASLKLEPHCVSNLLIAGCREDSRFEGTVVDIDRIGVWAAEWLDWQISNGCCGVNEAPASLLIDSWLKRGKAGRRGGGKGPEQSAVRAKTLHERKGWGSLEAPRHFKPISP